MPKKNDYVTEKEIYGSLSSWIQGFEDNKFMYFITTDNKIVCVKCADKSDPNNVIGHYWNFSTPLICEECGSPLLPENLVGSLSKFKKILTDFGFDKGEVLGTWGYNKKLLPENSIQVCTYTKGDFWVEKGGKKVYTGNYTSMEVTILIKILMKVTETA